MADVVNGARMLLQEYDADAVAPGFTERLEVAARGGTDGPEPRTIAAPYYLTDLGVRHFEDPSLFYQAHADHFEWSSVIDSTSTRELLLGASVNELAGLLDASVLLLGDYDIVVDVVRARFDEIELARDFDLQIYSGVILSAFGHEECRKMFDTAARQFHIGPVHRFMANHRLAATEIKRFKRPQRGMDLVNEIDSSMSRAAASGEISEGDRSAMASVTANLRALALLGLGDPDGARTEVQRARQMATVDGLSAVKRAESARYAAQESINIAQLLVLEEHDDQAIPVLAMNVDYCRDNCPEYLGEALCALAYGQYLMQDYYASISTARQAIDHVAYEASPVRLRAIREVLVAALAAAGFQDAAGREIENMDADPLGLDVTRPRTRGGKEGRL